MYEFFPDEEIEIKRLPNDSHQCGLCGYKTRMPHFSTMPLSRHILNLSKFQL